MRIVLSDEFFRVAPRFRPHEGLVGARYHIKEGRHAHEPGLWFVKEPQSLEIAKQVSSVFEPRSRAQARGQYMFSTITAQPGDAIYDYHVYFPGARDGCPDKYDQDPDYFAKMYEAHVRNGALVRFHIPKDEFHRDYCYDDVKREWRLKPYAMKLATKDILLKFPDGSAEEVPAYTEVTLRNGQITTSRIKVLHGGDERVIAGQPLEFYLREAGEKKQELNPDAKIDWEDLILAGFGQASGFASSGRWRNGKVRYPNPYAVLSDMYEEAAGLFLKYKVALSPEQKADFDAHREDIRIRRAHFDANPLEPA